MLPVEAQATNRAPTALAWLMPTVMPRSLNDAVGFWPSCLSPIDATPANCGDPVVPVDRRAALGAGDDVLVGDGRAAVHGIARRPIAARSGGKPCAEGRAIDRPRRVDHGVEQSAAVGTGGQRPGGGKGVAAVHAADQYRLASASSDSAREESWIRLTAPPESHPKSFDDQWVSERINPSRSITQITIAVPSLEMRRRSEKTGRRSACRSVSLGSDSATGRGDLLGELAADDRAGDVMAIRVVELAAAGDQRQRAFVRRTDDLLDRRVVGVEQLLPLDGVPVDVAVSPVTSTTSPSARTRML